MKKLLLTGASGFIGRNVLPLLKEKCEVTAPRRSELDLRDAAAVEKYLKENRFDAVFHCANPNPTKNELDTSEKMVEDSLRIFMHFYNNRDLYGKLIYLGSGAEYDKTHDICSVTEEHCFDSIPKDGYGFAKFIMNSLAAKADNVVNLCIFGCYGPTDHPSKFITHCISCCLHDEPITIRQDCYFDFLHVCDLAEAVLWHIENDGKFSMYNITSGKRLLLSEIAEEVRRQMHSEKPVVILNGGFNREYTASNLRFAQESGLEPKISIEQGIAIQIISETENAK